MAEITHGTTGASAGSSLVVCVSAVVMFVVSASGVVLVGSGPARVEVGGFAGVVMSVSAGFVVVGWLWGEVGAGFLGVVSVVVGGCWRMRWALVPLMPKEEMAAVRGWSVVGQ
ncbi:hypothetical protein, partial [Nonomuraea sp. NPDC050643]|uniref:hypothetical protein n=1 Tax=Nonomuraea sp. NPDC050643 TaxID=3155660 RepID=UPI00340339B5